MNASKFLKEYIRMCTSMPCSKCALYGTNSCLDDVGDGSTSEDIGLLVSAVEKWSKEHPIITNLEKMVEIFGDETVDFLEAYLRYTCTDDVFRKEASAWLGEEYKDVDKK